MAAKCNGVLSSTVLQLIGQPMAAKTYGNSGFIIINHLAKIEIQTNLLVLYLPPF